MQKYMIRVKELLKILQKASKAGKKDYFVQIMVVKDGYTFAQHIHSAHIAERYDGERFWIIPEEEVIPPEWSTNGKM